MQNKKINFGFTFVELIVITVILVILSAIGFVSYTGYIKGVRDSNRISQLNSIRDSLEMAKSLGNLPLPEDSVQIVASGIQIGTQGYVGESTLSRIDFKEGGKDPKDKTYYSYYVTKDKRYFQLMTFLEDKETDITFIPSVYAFDYSKRIPQVTGDNLGILTDINNTPIQEISLIKGVGNLDIVNTGTSYVAYISNNTKLSGSGGILKQIIPNASCKRILEVGGNSEDGIYTISPNGITSFDVYCDMTYGGITDFLMGEGNFNNGQGISTESGSNPTNTIEEMISPIKSGYVLHQTGDIGSEYEIHFPDVNLCKAGQRVTLTMWITNSSGSTFHHRLFTGGSTFYLNGDSDGNPLNVLQTQVINGKTWELKQVSGIILTDLTDFHWYIGWGAEDPKDLYFTGVRLSCL